ncbi:MAG TPA: hypothetical protein VFP47_03785 [Pyrinomonadaceae bacterium]|nr:hypothetical protein [Pyrinomonadaceae bacterium]
MEQLARGLLQAQWFSPPGAEPRFEDIKFQFNPTELSYDKSAQIAEITIPGLDAPLQQYIRGQAEKLTLDLFFDTSEKVEFGKVVSVTRLTDAVYKLIKIEPKRHAPPICTFFWNQQFPGSSLALPAQASQNEHGEAGSNTAKGNQARNGFRCIVESVKQKFTFFSPEGVPLRATLTVTLREYRTLEEQLAQLGRTSPDRTHSHVLQHGETLSDLAGQYYQHPGDWRFIADENGIEDPRRLAPGSFLTIPPTR